MGMSPHIRDLRAAVGSTKLLLSSVSGIVRDGRGSILLVQQNDSGAWSTPGGAVEMQETPADAVVREVWEETGLLVRPTRLIAVYGGPAFVVRYPNGDESQYISAIFECVVESGTLQSSSGETLAARFMSYDEAAQAPLAPWLPKVLRRLYDETTAAWFESPTWQP